MRLWGLVQASAVLAFPDGSLVDQTFDPRDGPDGAVQHLAILGNGSLLIAGAFEHYRGVPRPGLARVFPEGSLDPAFDSRDTFSGAVEELLVLPGDLVLVGGRLAVPGQSEPVGVLRLREDGTRDTAFDPPLELRPEARSLVSGGRFQPGIRFARAPEGKVILDARPFRVNGREVDTLVRLRADGSWEESFRCDLPLYEWDVRRLATARDGSIWIAGSLGEGRVGGAQTFGLVRVRADGRRDPGFPLAHVPPWVEEIVVLRDDKVVGFGVWPDRRATVFRLNADGSPDASFTVATVEVPYLADGFGRLGALAVGADDRTVLAHNVAGVNGIRRRGLALLEASGALSMSFDPVEGFACDTWTCPGVVAVDSVGRFVVGGQFTRVEGQPRHRLARLHPAAPPYAPTRPYWGASSYGVRESDGVVTLQCAQGPRGGYWGVRYTTMPGSALEGSDYVGQSGVLFFGPGGVATLTLRILEDDVEEGWETFRVVLEGPAEAGDPAEATVWIQDNDFRYDVTVTAPAAASETQGYARLRVTVRTTAKAYGGQDLVPPEDLFEVEYEELGAHLGRDYLPLLRPWFHAVDRGDGLAPYTVWAELRLPLVDNDTWDDPRQLRLHFRSRSPWVTFSPPSVLLPFRDNDTLAGPGRVVHGRFTTVAPTDDNGWLVSGSFDAVDGHPRPGLARLEPDAVLDESYAPMEGPDGPVRVLLEGPEGEVVVAGEFSRVGLQERHSVARYLPDGRLDPAFVPPSDWSVPGQPVAYAHGQRLADGRIVLAGRGRFRELAWIPGVVRLLPDGSADPAFETEDLGLAELTALSQMPDHRWLVAGRRRLSGLPVLLRLDENGQRDPAFELAAQGAIRALWCEADGRVWVGSEAGLVRLPPSVEGTPGTALEEVGRLLHTNVISGLIGQPDGRKLAVLEVNGAHSLVRLNAQGQWDEGFTPFSVAHNFGDPFRPPPVAVNGEGVLAVIPGDAEAQRGLTRYGPDGRVLLDLRIDRLVREATGEVHLSTRGQAVGRWGFLRSTRLRRDWTSVSVPVFSQWPPYNLVDTNAARLPHAFYQVSW
jgi:uncharacterized delta-60 repeat protein